MALYSKVLALSLVAMLGLDLAEAEEANPPSWPSSVSIFDPSMSNENISAVVEAAYAINGGDPRTTECGNGEVRRLAICGNIMLIISFTDSLTALSLVS